jgi:TP901 family phage tail tape measure protein
MVFVAAQFPGMIKRGTKEFETLQQAALAVGESTEFSAQDAAEGLTLLATAGLSAEAAIAALPKVVNFATASKVEFARASDIANDAMGAFGLTTKDATQNAMNMSRVMDVFTRASADSTTNVEELFEAVKMGGNIAKTAGVSLETFIGYTEILASTGIKGGEAGTAIRNMFLELGAPSTAAVKGMAKLGVTLAKTKKGAIDMTATVARFAKATSKMTEAQKIQALGNVFGARTIGPFIALMNAGTGKIGEFQTALENATGTTEGIAKELQGDALGALRNFDSLVSGVKLDVFMAIRPVLMELVKAAGDWVTANRDLVKTKAAEWIATLRDNLPEIWKWTVRIVEALAGLAVLSVVVKTITAIVTVVGWLSAAWAALSGVFAAAGAGFGFMVLGPLLLVVAAIAAVVAIVWAFWPEITSFFSALADWAVAAFGRLWTATVEIFHRWTAFLVGILEFVVGVFMLIWSPIGAWFMGIWNRVVAYLAEVWSHIATQLIAAYGLFLQVWSPIGEFFSGLWDGVVANFSEIWTQIVALAMGAYSMFLEVWSPLTAFFSSLWQGIVDTFHSIVGPIIDAISGFIGKARAIGKATLGTEAAPGAPAEGGPQVISPQARAASESAEATANASVNGEIVVSAAPGTKATATTKPRSMPLKVAQSGAF